MSVYAWKSFYSSHSRERQQWLRKLFIRFALAYIHIKKEETKSIMQNYPFLSIVR